MSASRLEYSEVPARALAEDVDLAVPTPAVAAAIERHAHVPPRPANVDGERELVGETEVVHRFVDAPGDSETVRWHLVEAGRGEPVVFLHGIPESWFMWHYQIEALALTHRVIAVDLKGYGQSDKRSGDYRQESVAEQLLALLDALDLERVDLVTHDRGTVVADYLAANHPRRVLRYVRGEQHLWHFNPKMAPQELIFTNPETRGILGRPNVIVPVAYAQLSRRPIADTDVVRSIQEFAYDRIGWAVPRYFDSSSFRKEWIDRRNRLMAAWEFPVLVLQGRDDPKQPREWYDGVERHMPDARVRFIDAGHFYVFENPDATTAAITDFLGTEARQ